MSAEQPEFIEGDILAGDVAKCGPDCPMCEPPRYVDSCFGTTIPTPERQAYIDPLAEVFAECPNDESRCETTVLKRERKDEPGKTFDAGKIRFDLIPPEWEKALAKVMTAGAEKYADRNWEKGLSWSRRYGSARRHLNAFWAGEDFDKETGLPHLAHAAWNCLAILTFMKTHPEFDDRVKETK